MKKLLLITTLLFSFMALKAQKTEPVSLQPIDTTVFARTESEPQYPGGLPKLYNIISRNVKSNGEKGTTYVSFIVEKDGSLTQIKVIRGLSETTTKEIIKTMQMSPKWIPATQDGHVVRVWYTVPIHFN